HADDPLGALNKLPESWRDAALEHYSSSHATDSPEETLRFLEAQPEGPKRNQEIQRAFSNWAAREPSQAAEWVQGLPDSEQKEIAASNPGSTWARTDPAAAMEWVENQPPSARRDQAAEQAILAGGGHHPEGALSLALTISDHEIRDSLVMQTVD